MTVAQIDSPSCMLRLKCREVGWRKDHRILWIAATSPWRECSHGPEAMGLDSWSWSGEGGIRGKEELLG